MKKTLRSLLTFAIIIFGFSCTELELQNPEDVEHSIIGKTAASMICCGGTTDFTAWRSRTTDVTRHNFTQYGLYLGTIKFGSDVPPTYAYLNTFKETRYNLEHFMDNPDDFDLDALASQIAILENPYATKSFKDMLEQDFPYAASLFGNRQKIELSMYSASMEGIIDASGATQAYNNAMARINQTSFLTEQQKTEARLFVEFGHEFALEYFSGRQQDVINHIQTETSKSVSGGCSISFRDVWRDAVWGFFSGGTVTAYIVGTGGTLIVPGVGTVTGAVSGFFIGGASGFTTGAVQSVASQLFWNCFMNSPISDPNLSCSDFDFSINNQEFCNIDQQAPNLRWYLISN